MSPIVRSYLVLLGFALVAFGACLFYLCWFAR